MTHIFTEVGDDLDLEPATARGLGRFTGAQARGAALQRGAKRLIDIVGALTGLAFAAPVMFAIYVCLAPAPAPVIFTQTRIGRGGVRFQCLKFRTMAPGAERALARIASNAEWARTQKLANDPRVTRFGRVLRRWGLDELPQLINVLRGDMSLVGPRPIVAPEIAGYPADRAYAEGPAFAAYAAVRPGLTGLWQVSGGAETPHAARVRLDRAYVEGWSLWRDIRIMAATPMAVIRRRHG